MHALIKSLTPSFRRAGIQFTAAGHRVDLAGLTNAQLEAIYSEPRLVVTLIEESQIQATAPIQSSAVATETPPAASGTQQDATGDEQAPAAAVAAAVPATAEAGTGGAAVGSQLRMPPAPVKTSKAKAPKQ